MSCYPKLRLRRLRDDDYTRRLVAENSLSVNDLIWPIFVHSHPKRVNIAAMPGVERLSLDDLWRMGERALSLGIPFMALFPVIEEDQKDVEGCLSEDAEGLIIKAVRGLKQRFPQLGVMTDVALDPYTTHGHDGIVDDNGYVLNDETIERLCRIAVLQAQAGADIVAPSDMMDGRVGCIRQALESAGFPRVKILSYAVKYASAFYTPFRHAVGSYQALGSADKSQYQMNPANSKEALREVALDVKEGADMVMIKPAMPYLDIIRIVADDFQLPVIAYQVSGEYVMLQSLNQFDAITESLIAFKRAGASAIVTYFAQAVAQRYLQQLS